MAAIVTGGASGLGEATALRLAKAGVKVAIFDMDEARGAKVAAQTGGSFHKVDVTDQTQVDQALDAARGQNGQERILVNCAGIAIAAKTAGRKRDGAMLAHDLDDFARVIKVNLIGTFHVCAKSALGMLTLDPINDDGGRGVMVMTSSVAAEDGQIGQVAYAASKGGVKSLTLPMARDLAREGIRTVSILPGLFHTPMFDGLPDEVRDALAAQVPHPSRLGDPGEYAALVQHICENDMLNGVSIRLDGAIRMAPA
jgi:NAD(P)-dependent dehydrogenase (short-subunit alcohol dehydrogenase family)